MKPRLLLQFVAGLGLAVANDLQCEVLNVSCVAREVSRIDAVRCSRRLTLALVGAGNFAKKAHLPSIIEDARDCFELKAVWSRTQSSVGILAAMAKKALAPWAARSVEVVRTFWGEDGWHELLRSGYEVFDIVLPIGEQHRYVAAALARGLTVISEKPAAPTVKRAKQLLDAAAAAGAIGRSRHSHWMVAENWRFETSFRTAARLRELGAIGRVLAFSAVSIGNVPEGHAMLTPGSWRVGQGANWVLDVGVHMVAAMRAVLGENLIAHGMSASRRRPDLGPLDTFATSLALSTSGAPGTWLFSVAAPRPVPAEVPGLSSLELTVFGTEGSLMATRDRVELRDGQGNLLSAAGGLASHSVALALRASAKIVSGDGGQIGVGSVSAIEAVADLHLVEDLLQAAKSPADTSDAVDKVEL